MGGKALGCVSGGHTSLPICDRCGLEYDLAAQSLGTGSFLPPNHTKSSKRLPIARGGVEKNGGNPIRAGWQAGEGALDGGGADGLAGTG